LRSPGGEHEQEDSFETESGSNGADAAGVGKQNQVMSPGGMWHVGCGMWHVWHSWYDVILCYSISAAA